MSNQASSLAVMTSVLIGLCSLDCNTDPSPTEPIPYSPPTNLINLIPLEIGNTWKYLTVWCGDVGKCDTTVDSTRIVDTLQIAGKKHFGFYGTPPHLSAFEYGETYLETLDSNDYSMYLCMGCLAIDEHNSANQALEWLPLHLLKTPLVRGHQWRCAEWDSAYGFDFGSVTIVSVDTTIRVADREFTHAIHLRQQSSSFDAHDYVIVPGVGTVRNQVTGGFYSSRSELVEWVTQ